MENTIKLLGSAVVLLGGTIAITWYFTDAPLFGWWMLPPPILLFFVILLGLYDDMRRRRGLEQPAITDADRPL